MGGVRDGMNKSCDERVLGGIEQIVRTQEGMVLSKK